MRDRAGRPLPRSVYPPRSNAVTRRDSRLGCAVYVVAVFLILLFAAIALGGRIGSSMFS